MSFFSTNYINTLSNTFTKHFILVKAFTYISSIKCVTICFIRKSPWANFKPCSMRFLTCLCFRGGALSCRSCVNRQYVQSQQFLQCMQFHLISEQPRWKLPEERGKGWEEKELGQYIIQGLTTVFCHFLIRIIRCTHSYKNLELVFIQAMTTNYISLYVSGFVCLWIYLVYWKSSSFNMFSLSKWNEYQSNINMFLNDEHWHYYFVVEELI